MAVTHGGQASILLVGGLCALVIGAFILGGVARGIGVRSDAQRTADLAALAGARAMHDAYPRLFAPATIDDRSNPSHLEKAAYLAIGRRAAAQVLAANGRPQGTITFPDARQIAPVRIRVSVTSTVTAHRKRAKAATRVVASAEAALDPASDEYGPTGGAGEYPGPFAERQGKRMRPDVAQAFDRLERAAAGSGVRLVINSAFRSDAEQAALFAQHPDPKWVAPPGHSLHRYGTELDLGPPAAYAWLKAHAPSFHFVQRYSWEPWHWGLAVNPASTARQPTTGDGAGSRTMPSFVPPEYERPIVQAAQRYNVSAALLAAQLYAESGFNPFAVSPRGAQGLAQFMPGTADAYGLADPFDPERAIDAQARLMRDLLRRFGSVPLALAAYNAGPERVAACGCVPPFPETRGYVARILGLMNGAGAPLTTGSALAVRLVR
jgi:hypothetical protein